VLCAVLCCAVLCCAVCSMRLLQNTSRGIGDLILIYKRMTGLAGHTSRVAELLEQVRTRGLGGRQEGGAGGGSSCTAVSCKYIVPSVAVFDCGGVSRLQL
jgi:hypothetical protein